MKKLNLNKKGFTLIELLAVIVILALLVAVAVPAVTRYLNTARAGVMSTDAATAISAVRTDVMTSGVEIGSSYSQKDKIYYLAEINKYFLESSKRMEKSPYGGYYVSGTCSNGEIKTQTECEKKGQTWTASGSYVKVTYDETTQSYEYCIFLYTDDKKYIDQKEANVSSEKVETYTITATTTSPSVSNCEITGEENKDYEYITPHNY